MSDETTNAADAARIITDPPPLLTDAAAGSGAFFTNDETLKEVAELVKPRDKPIDPNAPEMVRGGEPDERKAIGNFVAGGKIVSYAISRYMAVTVTANTTGDGTWSFTGVKDGRTVISGSIFGGKWQAAQYCKFVRNGIVSRANRLGHGRKARKAEIADGGEEAAQ